MTQGDVQMGILSMIMLLGHLRSSQCDSHSARIDNIFSSSLVSTLLDEKNDSEFINPGERISVRYVDTLMNLG